MRERAREFASQPPQLSGMKIKRLVADGKSLAEGNPGASSLPERVSVGV